MHSTFISFAFSFSSSQPCFNVISNYNPQEKVQLTMYRDEQEINAAVASITPQADANYPPLGMYVAQITIQFIVRPSDSAHVSLFCEF